MSIPLWLQCTHLLMATFSRIKQRYKTQIISDWFLEHDNEVTLLKWPPQSPDLNPIEHFWDVVEREIHIMDAQLTNLQQLCDAIMSIWPKSLRNVSNTLLNLCHEELRQFWRQKGVQPGTSKVYLIKWPVSVCVYIYIYIYFTRKKQSDIKIIAFGILLPNAIRLAFFSHSNFSFNKSNM